MGSIIPCQSRAHRGSVSKRGWRVKRMRCRGQRIG
jgi:hypothetical protein